ncbi:MAG: hypothetical protein QXW77_04035, partial [Candidatus Hadarchaeales archaeon]
MEREFRKMVGKTEPSLPQQRRREILRYLAHHHESTPYQIAKDLFGNGVAYTATAIRHLRRLAKIGAVTMKKVEGTYRVSLTEEGRTLCISEGIITPEDQKVGIFLHDLNKALDPPLSPDESKELRGVLSTRLLEALEEIAREYHSIAKDPDLPPPSPLEAVWIYETEKTVLLPKVEKWKESLSSYIEEISFPLLNLPPPQAPELREGVMKVMERVGVGNVLKEALLAIQIAKKRQVEAELDRLLPILDKIVK